MASSLRTVASVLPMLLPCGRYTLTSTSGRSEPGKNCFSTSTTMPATDSASTPSVPNTTDLRQVTHQVISARRRRYIGV